MSPSPQTPLLRESLRQFVRLSGGGDGGDGTNTISGQLVLRPSLARVSLKKVGIDPKKLDFSREGIL